MRTHGEKKDVVMTKIWARQRNERKKRVGNLKWIKEDGGMVFSTQIGSNRG